MIDARWHRHLDRRWTQLTVGLWLLRLSLLWLLGAPIYHTFAESRLLQSHHTDLALLRPGADMLLALIDSRRQALSGLYNALRPLLMVSGAIAWFGSMYAWVALLGKATMFGRESWGRAWSVAPKLALVSVGSMVTSGAIAYGWWSVSPILGAALEPTLGERNTDLAQLLVVGVVAVILALTLVIADVMRAMLIRRDSSVSIALLAAARVVGSQPLRVSYHAAIRCVLVLLCQVCNAWAIGHWHWLAQSQLWLVLAIATTEIAAIVAIRVRLDWIAWISEFERTVTTQLRK